MCGSRERVWGEATYGRFGNSSHPRELRLYSLYIRPDNILFRKYLSLGNTYPNWRNSSLGVVVTVHTRLRFAFLRLTRLSKKSKIQSHGLAPAILEGLMPIASEDEPEDIDDDAPSRVSLCPAHLCNFVLILTRSSLLSESSTACQHHCLQRKCSPPSAPSSSNTSPRKTLLSAVVLCSLLESPLRDAASS
jgi:hypothetical protein